MKPVQFKVLIAQGDTPLLPDPGEFLPEDGAHGRIFKQKADLKSEIAGSMSLSLVLLEWGFSGEDVLQVCRELKSGLEGLPVAVVVILPQANPKHLSESVMAGADDVFVVPMPVEQLSNRVASVVHLKNLINARDGVENILKTLGRVMAAKDPGTLAHSERVGQFASTLGQCMNLSSMDQATLRKGGILQDIGKIQIPDQILKKPGRFTPEEFEVMKAHPIYGCEIVAPLLSVRDALPLIRHHHEKMDGTGYPDGLKGSDIPLLARVITIVDIYDALRSKRSYKEPFSKEKTFAIMWDEVYKGWWDKEILETWEKYVNSLKSDTHS